MLAFRVIDALPMNLTRPVKHEQQRRPHAALRVSRRLRLLLIRTKTSARRAGAPGDPPRGDANGSLTPPTRLRLRPRPRGIGRDAYQYSRWSRRKRLKNLSRFKRNRRRFPPRKMGSRIFPSRRNRKPEVCTACNLKRSPRSGHMLRPTRYRYAATHIHTRRMRRRVASSRICACEAIAQEFETCFPEIAVWDSSAVLSTTALTDDPYRARWHGLASE